MDVKVMFFARSRELAGCSEAVVSVPEGTDTAGLQAALLQQYPNLAQVFGSCLLSLNLEYVDAEEPRPLKAGDEVGIIPPISGG